MRTKRRLLEVKEDRSEIQWGNGGIRRQVTSRENAPFAHASHAINTADGKSAARTPSKNNPIPSPLDSLFYQCCPIRGTIMTESSQ